MCPNCKHQLTAKDLVPVFSWVFLRGKCRYCKKPISKQYPLVELLVAVLFVVSYLAWPTNLNSSWQYINFATWLVAVVGLVALAIYDIKWMLLPDKIIYPVMVLAIISFLIQVILGRPTSDIPKAFLAALIGGGLFWLIYQVSQGKWIGGGDVKLGFLLGILVATPELAFLTLFLASIIGLIWILPMLVTKKLTKTSKVPFGPFLIAAAMIVVLYGPSIISWYKSLFMIS
jgi:prepilin signal peptidase PulO-like enzyme (type II secretory pathway)